MRISSVEFYNQSIDALMTQQGRLNDLQNQIALGKKITKPSDDPNGSVRALELKQEISKIDQYSRNTSLATTNLSFEESVLGSVVSQYQRVKELAITANNSTMSSTERNAIANELSVILDELVSLANSKNGFDEYLFSGFKSNTAAVNRSVNGQFVYQGDEGQKKLQINDSTLIETNDTAKDLFFNLATSQITPTNHTQITNVSSSNPGLVATGSLASMDANELVINNIVISPAEPDLTSTADSNRSAIAIANAINAQKSQHGVDAIVQPNNFDLGVYTGNPLVAGDFTINGVDIIEPTGTESALIDAINTESMNTGVTATQPGGPGTGIILSADDGRNIQLQTTGIALADFANYSLALPSDMVKRGDVVLRDHSPIEIQGSQPQDADFTRGTYTPNANTGTGSIQTQVIDNIDDLTESYSIVFNPGATTFDIVRDSNPSITLEGFDNVTYVPGEAIEFNGLSVVISGTPNAGDTFSVELGQSATQDIFTTTENLINSIRNITEDPTRLNYEIGIALNNFDVAESQLNNVRAKVGARLNMIDSLESNNQNTKFLAQTTLSRIEDLDYAEAISNLSQLTLTLQAAQQSFSRIQGLSLFNFL